MKTTLKKLSIPKPNGGFDNLYLDDFATYDDLHAELSELKKLVSKLHFEKNEVTEIHPFYIQSLEDENMVYDSSVECRLSYHAADVEYSYGDKWRSLENVENITVDAGERVYFRYVGDEYLSGGVEDFVGNAVDNELKLRLTTTTKTFDVGGDVRTIVYGNTTKESISENGLKCFFYNSNVVNADKLIMTFKSVGQEGCYNMFYGCTSLTTAPDLPATTLASWCYRYMFVGCTGLTTAPELPATKLANYCYESMFQGCTSLTTAPELPATTLASYCYFFMFDGCTSLTKSPELPATTLAENCYWAMFKDCTSLTTAPELPATTLADGCYHMMFYGCTSLTTTPELPATTLADYCYYMMFQGCTSLTTAPELPATTLASDCYQNMFSGCTSLTTAPELPATTLAYSCYEGMFNGCTGLTTAPELPATTLAGYCYRSMFQGCTSLITAPELPATTLSSECYESMFNGCTSLTQAPVLPATTLVGYCYQYMFYGCSNLNYIKCLATDISATDCTYDWVLRVASTGTFVKDVNSTWTVGNSGIPEGWEVKLYNAVTFTAEEASSTIGLNKLSLNQTLEYSTDTTNWNTMNTSTLINLSNIGDKVYVRGVLSGNNTDSYTLFKMTGKIAASGNCNALWNYNDLNAPLKAYCGYYMFYGCTSLTQSPELPATTLAYSCYSDMFRGCTSLTTAPELPATTLAGGCYTNMFSHCTSLTQSPELPATTLASSCYNRMFLGCTSLTTAPELPVTTLEQYCYNNMFLGCTSLTTAPELPATTLASYCYESMFNGCTSLTQAPVLPATTLASYCYHNMFNGCSNLNYIKCLATDMSATDCTYNWVNGVSPTGTFVKDVNSSWTVGDNGIPEGWEVKQYNAVTFTAEEAGSTIGLNSLSSYQTLEYKTESSDWTSMSVSTNITLDNIGDKVYVRGVLGGNNTDSNYTQFKMTGKISSSGNCNSLWNYNDLNAHLKAYCGYKMFYNCTSLTQAPELPATTLAYGCYYYMFYKCTSLIKAPELPATTLVGYCYKQMFQGCTSLTQAPELTATTLTKHCYFSMFQGCTGLTTAPELPATTLAIMCYAYMFSDCTSLTKAPELPATTLVQECYFVMFEGCSNLNYIKCLATDRSEYNCTYDWVRGVYPTGTFVKSSGTSWSTGTSGIPSGWEVIDDGDDVQTDE